MKFLLLLCLLAFVTACDSDSPSSNNSNNTTGSGCMDPSFSFWIGVYDPQPKVNGICETALWRRMNADSWSDMQVTTAQFCVGPEKAGSVEYISVNGIQLAGDSSLYLTSQIIPFWDHHIWSFGGGDVPPTYDSVLTVREFGITYPRYLTDTVSKKGFTVKYESTGTDSVFIYFIYDNNLSNEYDPTIVDSNFYSSIPTGYKFTGGSTTIPSSVFAQSLLSPAFPDKGVVRMYIIAFRKKLVTSGGKKYLLRTGERCETAFFLRK